VGLNTGEAEKTGIFESPRQAAAGDGRDLVLGGAIVLVQFNDPIGKILSNPAPTPFVLDGVTLASVEAFIQGIKFSGTTSEGARVFGLYGLEAKHAGRAVSVKIAQRREKFESASVYWKGEEIPFGSDRHLNLIERAIAAKFKQNPDAAGALVSTGNALLIHPIPNAPHTSLKAEEFVRILMLIRSDLATPPAA